MTSLAGLFVQEALPGQRDTVAPEVLCAHIRYFPPYGEAEEHNCCFFLYLRIRGGDSLTLDSLVLNDSRTLCYPSSGKYLITKPRDVNEFQKSDTLRLVLPQQNCFLENPYPVLYLKMISDVTEPAVKPNTAQLYYTFDGVSDSISFPVLITVVKPDQIPIENPCFQ